jgi:hypothetical protein
MEDVFYGRFKTQGEDSSVTFYIDNDPEFYYKFSRIDGDSGIVQCRIKYKTVPKEIVRYMVNDISAGRYKIIKGTGKFCVQSDIDDEDEFNNLKKVWLGKYRLVTTVSRDEKIDTIQFLFNVLKDKFTVSYFEDNNKIYQSELPYTPKSDSLIVRRHNDKGEIEDEFIFNKYGDSFSVSGQSISLINPPNEEYPLDKIE